MKYKLSTGLRNVLGKIGIASDDLENESSALLIKRRLIREIKEGKLQRGIYNGKKLPYFGDTKLKELVNYLGCSRYRTCPKCKGSGKISF